MSDQVHEVTDLPKKKFSLKLPKIDKKSFGAGAATGIFAAGALLLIADKITAVAEHNASQETETPAVEA